MEPPERYCSNCGQRLRPEDRFCSNCGKPVHLTAYVPTPEADVPVPPRKTAPSQQPTETSGARRAGGSSGEASFSIKEMVILGVAAGVFTLLTSPWEKLPGTLLYAILTPMMGAVIASIIKAYLSGVAVGGQRLAILGTLTALWRFSALPRETKRTILLAALRSSAGVGVVSSIISVSTVVGVQASINTIQQDDLLGPGGAPTPTATPIASPTATAPATATPAPTTATTTATATATPTTSP